MKKSILVLLIIPFVSYAMEQLEDVSYAHPDSITHDQLCKLVWEYEDAYEDQEKLIETLKVKNKTYVTAAQRNKQLMEEKFNDVKLLHDRMAVDLATTKDELKFYKLRLAERDEEFKRRLIYEEQFIEGLEQQTNRRALPIFEMEENSVPAAPDVAVANGEEPAPAGAPALIELLPIEDDEVNAPDAGREQAIEDAFINAKLDEIQLKLNAIKNFGPEATAFGSIQDGQVPIASLSLASMGVLLGGRMGFRGYKTWQKIKNNPEAKFVTGLELPVLAAGSAVIVKWVGGFLVVAFILYKGNQMLHAGCKTERDRIQEDGNRRIKELKDYFEKKQTDDHRRYQHERDELTRTFDAFRNGMEHRFAEFKTDQNKWHTGLDKKYKEHMEEMRQDVKKNELLHQKIAHDARELSDEYKNFKKQSEADHLASIYFKDEFSKKFLTARAEIEKDFKQHLTDLEENKKIAKKLQESTDELAILHDKKLLSEFQKFVKANPALLAEATKEKPLKEKTGFLGRIGRRPNKSQSLPEVDLAKAKDQIMPGSPG